MPFVHLFELHEAFAATVVKARQELGIEDDRLNVNGGVIALGHPMGATGAIMAGVLLDELERRGHRMLFLFTITGYGRALEPGVPSLDEQLALFLRLMERVGERRVVLEDAETGKQVFP